MSISTRKRLCVYFCFVLPLLLSSFLLSYFLFLFRFLFFLTVSMLPLVFFCFSLFFSSFFFFFLFSVVRADGQTRKKNVETSPFVKLRFPFLKKRLLGLGGQSG